MSELNITPLLDLVFVLLVIFIITTPQLTNSLEINLPSGRPVPPPTDAPRPKLNRIRVDERGQAHLNGTPLALADLRRELLRLRESDPDPGVVVEGANDVAYQSMIDVLDLLQRLRITKVGLATDSAPPAPR